MAEDDTPKIFLCDNVDCRARGSLELRERMEDMLDARNADEIEVHEYTCFGGCDIGPNVIVYPARAWYAGVQTEDVAEIIDHVTGAGPRVERLETADRTTVRFIINILDAGGWGSI